MFEKKRDGIECPGRNRGIVVYYFVFAVRWKSRGDLPGKGLAHVALAVAVLVALRRGTVAPYRKVSPTDASRVENTWFMSSLQICGAEGRDVHERRPLALPVSG